MKTDLEHRLRAGLREYADAVTVIAPPLSAITTAVPPRSRRWRRILGLPMPQGHRFGRPSSKDGARLITEARTGRGRRFGLPVLAAGGVLTIVAALVLLPLALPRADPSAGGNDVPASLPERFAGFSFLTGDLAAAPISRALAVYVQRNNAFEDFHADWQTLLLDADGMRYRRTGAVDFIPGTTPQHPGDVPFRPGLLSPEGRLLALNRGTSASLRELAVLRVGTGMVTPHTLPAADAYLRPVAWSPDGRLLAYVAAAPNTRDGPLGILEVETGEFTSIPGIEMAQEAAFSPDGSQIAVQSGAEIVMIDRSGRVLRRLPLADGLHLSGPAAWSPDGRLLTVIRYRTLPIGAPWPQAQAIAFIDTQGGIQARALPAELSIDASTLLQGWRNREAIVIWDHRRLIAVPIDGGTPTSLSTTGDEVVDLQLASGMLITMSIAKGGAVDRGPWPGWARKILVAGLSILAVPVIVLTVWRWHRRARR